MYLKNPNAYPNGYLTIKADLTELEKVGDILVKNNKISFNKWNKFFNHLKLLRQRNAYFFLFFHKLCDFYYRVSQLNKLSDSS